MARTGLDWNPGVGSRSKSKQQQRSSSNISALAGSVYNPGEERSARRLGDDADDDHDDDDAPELHSGPAGLDSRCGWTGH